MNESHSDRTRRAGRAVGLFLLGTIVFGVVYTQAPLYYSNQNQYFLHGLAQGGHAHLDRDWLSTSADPTPVFTALVSFTYRFLGPSWFHVYYFIILGVYFWSMVGIFNELAPGSSPLLRLTFVTTFLFLHAAIARYYCEEWIEWDYLYYVQLGLAGQYILGPVYQPSVHGTLLLLAIWLFLRDKPILAGGVVGLTAFIHSTYLLMGGLFTFAFLCVLAKQRRWRDALCTGGLALAMVTPVLIYNLSHFGPTDADTFEKALRIVVHFRIPHHTEFAWWLNNYVVWFQIAAMVLALPLLRGSKLLPIYAIPFFCSLALTLLQWATGSDTLALLFPWRTSAVLAPLAVTIILTRLVLLMASGIANLSPRGHVALAGGLLAVIAFLVVGGLWVSRGAEIYRITASEEPMMAWIRANAGPDDRYLVPVQLPPAHQQAYESGELFKVVRPTVRKQGRIPVDLQRFRIFAGVPIHVDFKSIPYKDADVVEWFDRLLWTVKFYERARASQVDWRAKLKPLGVTHVLAGPGDRFQSPQLEEIYADDNYRVYRLVPE